jgi:glycine cleavage system H protein
MARWKTVRVRQELLTAVERTLEAKHYQSLSEFVSEAVQMRLNELRQKHEPLAKTQVEYPVARERLLCSPNHMWAMVTPEGNIRVGLSDYAQQHLKGIANIHVAPLGYETSKERPFGYVETWMFKFDLHAPVSGKLVMINETLREKPVIVNEDPYEEGWIAEIKPNNIVTLEEELRDLMGSRQYKTWTLKQRRFADAEQQESS